MTRTWPQHLAARFPGVQVVQGDAFDLDATLGKPNGSPFGAIVSGMPLLNFPMTPPPGLHGRPGSRLLPGAPLIQFSYGPHAPVVPPPGYT